MKKRIKELRCSMGLTQQQFADRLGLKRQTIAAYEVGNTEPSNATLLSICREYKVNENWLRTGEGEMKAAQTTQERYNLNLEKLQRVDDGTIIRWVNVIAETNPKVLKQIEEFMKKLLENQEEEN